MLSLMLFSATLASNPSGFNYDVWDRVTKNHIRPGAMLGMRLNVIDYHGMSLSKDFQEVVDNLAKVDLSDLSLNESFALGCNAYNVFAIKMLFDHACKYDAQGKCMGPSYGLPDIDHVWSRKLFTFGGQKVALNDVEAMMRPIPSAPLFSKTKLPIKEDLRVHACLVCDGASCPDVLFYSPDKINEQLDYAAKRWMANPWKGMRIVNNTVYFSAIMQWFKPEFDAQGGAVAAYTKFLPPAAKKFLAANKDYEIDYLRYVWDANGPVPCGCEAGVDDARVSWPQIHYAKPCADYSFCKNNTRSYY